MVEFPRREIVHTNPLRAEYVIFSHSSPACRPSLSQGDDLWRGNEPRIPQMLLPLWDTIPMSPRKDLETWRAKRCSEERLPGRQTMPQIHLDLPGTLDCVENKVGLRPISHILSHRAFLLAPPVSQPRWLAVRARQPCGSCASSTLALSSAHHSGSRVARRRTRS